MNTQNDRNGNVKKVWIGLAHVRPQPGHDLLGGGKGAFVQALAIVSGKRDFRAKVRERLNSYGYDVVSIEEIAPLKDVVCNRRVCENVKKLACFLTTDDPVALSTFHSYKETTDPIGHRGRVGPSGSSRDTGVGDTSANTKGDKE